MTEMLKDKNGDAVLEEIESMEACFLREYKLIEAAKPSPLAPVIDKVGYTINMASARYKGETLIKMSHLIENQ